MQRWVAYYDLQTVSPRSGSEIFNFNNQYFIIDGHSFGKLNHEMSGFRYHVHGNFLILLLY